MSRPSCSYLCSSVLRRRIRSVARCFAVAINQGPGLSGTPEVGHCSSAATSASCASSSAVPMSPTRRLSRAMSRGDSIRQIASIARCAGSTSRPLVLRDLAHLEGPAVVGRPLEPLEGLIDRAHFPEPVPGHELLALREWPVDDRALLPVELNPLTLRARGQTARSNDDARLDELAVEFLMLSHRLSGRGTRRFGLLTFLRQH